MPDIIDFPAIVIMPTIECYVIIMNIIIYIFLTLSFMRSHVTRRS